MVIEKDKVVSIDYTLKDKDGTVIDTSKNSTPLEYIHGRGNLISGLEKQLEGKAKGDSIKAVVEPKDAYGEYDESLLIDVPRKNFDSETEIKVGMQFQASTPGGPAIVKVTKITDDTITVDANHDLAGKTLYFDVDVMDIRDATAEELNPPSGCGGSCGSCGGGCGGSCGGDCGESCDCE